MRLLQRFLDNISAHPILKSDPILLKFVEASEMPFDDILREITATKSDSLDEEEMENEGTLIIPHKRQSIPKGKILSDHPSFPDPLDERLIYLASISTRLEALKLTLTEFQHAQMALDDSIVAVGKTLANALDATTDGGKHGQLILLIDTLESIEQLIKKQCTLSTTSNLKERADGFSIIVDDYIRLLQDIEAAFAAKREWRALVYSLDMKLIDVQAALLMSQNEAHRDFDKNYELTHQYSSLKKEAKNVIATFDVICQRLEAELDRIDANRMEEIEECLNGIISKMLETQNEINILWSNFIESANLATEGEKKVS